MKRLFILRHAEAIPKGAAQDIDRVLSDRGRAQMQEMAGRLRGANVHPQLALVSPAARTRETWSLAGLDDIPAQFDDRIYEAAPDDLLAVLRDADPGADGVMLVGHNPGLHQAACDLIRDDRPDDLRRLAELPTAALVTLDLDIPSWTSAAFRTGRLTDLMSPTK